MIQNQFKIKYTSQKDLIIFITNYPIPTVQIINLNNNKIINKYLMGIGDWGLGIGDWGLGIGPNPQSPIPNPQSPIPNPHCFQLI